MPRDFQFKSSQAFLTYAQCPIDRDYILDHITDLLASTNRPTPITISAHCIAQEKHQDGNFHIHAYFKFSSKLSFRNQSFFDIKYEGVNYHPNITAPRSPVAVIKYVQKDKFFIASENIEEIMNKKTYGTIAAQSTTKEEYMAALTHHFPRDVAMNYDRLEQYSRVLFPETKVTYTNPYIINGDLLPDALTEWCDNLTRPTPNPMTGTSVTTDIS